MSFISEAEEALLINLSVDCKYMSPSFRLFHIPWKTFYFENKRHKSHEMHCHTGPVQLYCIFKACLKPKMYVLYLAANAGHELPGLPEKNAELCQCFIALLCFVFSLRFHCVYKFKSCPTRV